MEISLMVNYDHKNRKDLFCIGKNITINLRLTLLKNRDFRSKLSNYENVCTLVFQVFIRSINL